MKLTFLILIASTTLCASTIYGPGGMFSLIDGPTMSAETYPDTQGISSVVTEELVVTSTALLTIMPASLGLGGNGPDLSNCVLNGPNGYCEGYDNDYAQIIGVPYSVVNFSGQYAFHPNGESNDLYLTCGYGFYSQCQFQLTPGDYTFSASVSDQLEEEGGATVTPFTEGFGGTITVNSGSVEVGAGSTVPEPSFIVPLMAALAFGIRRFKA